MVRILTALFAAVALCGVLVSGLALRVHYSTDTQPCDINERWDCGIVNHSRFAVVHTAHGEVPVAAIGILGYGALLALCFTGRRGLLLVGATLGLLYALSLTRIEAQVIHVWCLYCVISQGIIAILFLLAAWLFGLRLVQQGRPAQRGF